MSQDLHIESVAAYALDALDPAERRAFEAHLPTCADCQAELVDLRRVAASLGLTVDPVTPPADLKTRTIARATAAPRAPAAVDRRRGDAGRIAGIHLGTLAAAASLVLAASLGIYAWALRTEVIDLRHGVSDLADRANDLRNDLSTVRAEAARLTSAMDVVGAAGTLRVTLTGQAQASSASGRAFWNRGRGLIVSTDRLPALRPGRAYQLWMVMPGHAPVSAGVFSVSAAGTATFTAIVPADLQVPPGTPVTVAITEEPAGGSPGPTSDILLAGNIERG